MRLLIFSDIHFHHTHRFSHITPEGFTIRELEHISCADTILKVAKEEQIDKIIFCGDLYGPVGDGLSAQTQVAICNFLSKLKDYKIDMLVGNHDCAGQLNNQYSHKLEPFKHWENINVFDNPIVIDNFVYMPYSICDEFSESFLENIEDKENKIVFSHLELKGINLGNGIFTKKGIDISLLNKFKKTFQGHYHSGGKYGKNIYVIGSTQRLSFKDPGLSRNNILIYDTETDKIKKRSFECPDWLVFNDDNIEDILKIDNDNYVKLEITTDILLTKEIQDKLNKVKAKDIHIDITRISINKKLESEITAENNIEVIKQFIDKSDNTENVKEELVKEGVRLLQKVEK